MKNEINLPPFYVGQRVVRIGNTVPGIVIKGNIYTVSDCIQCANCKEWKVSCIEFPKKDKNYNENPCSCGFNFIHNVLLGKAALFAPVVENLQSISLEKVLEEETKLIGVN